MAPGRIRPWDGAGTHRGPPCPRTPVGARGVVWHHVARCGNVWPPGTGPSQHRTPPTRLWDSPPGHGTPEGAPRAPTGVQQGGSRRPRVPAQWDPREGASQGTWVPAPTHLHTQVGASRVTGGVAPRLHTQAAGEGTWVPAPGCTPGWVPASVHGCQHPGYTLRWVSGTISRCQQPGYTPRRVPPRAHGCLHPGDSRRRVPRRAHGCHHPNYIPRRVPPRAHGCQHPGYTPRRVPPRAHGCQHPGDSCRRVPLRAHGCQHPAGCHRHQHPSPHPPPPPRVPAGDTWVPPPSHPLLGTPRHPQPLRCQPRPAAAAVRRCTRGCQRPPPAVGQMLARPEQLGRILPPAPLPSPPRRSGTMAAARETLAPGGTGTLTTPTAGVVPLCPRGVPQGVP